MQYKIFLFSKYPTRSATHPAFYKVDTTDSLPGVKWRVLKVDRSFALSADIIISDSVPTLKMDGVERDKFSFTATTDDYY